MDLGAEASLKDIELFVDRHLVKLALGNLLCQGVPNTIRSRCNRSTLALWCVSSIRRPIPHLTGRLD